MTTTPRRPRKCGYCTMFGHDSRNCHLSFLSDAGKLWPLHGGIRDHGTAHIRDDDMVWAVSNYNRHCTLNQQWIAAGGAGHTVPVPEPPPPEIPKTPFEKACKNDCKITHADECCICMETLGEKNKVTTDCGHQFHFGCLHQHTTRSNSCPLCRSVIVPKLHQEDAEEEESDDDEEEGYRITLDEMDGVLNSISCSNSLLEIIPDIEQRTLVNDVYSRRLEYWFTGWSGLLRPPPTWMDARGAPG